MSKLKTQILSMCMVLILVFGVAGCGNSASEADTEAQGKKENAGQSQAEDTTEKEEITLTLWTHSLVPTEDALLDENDWWIRQAIERFQEEYPYVNVDITKMADGDESATLFKAAATAGTAPDLAEFWTGNWIVDLEDYAYPIYDLLPEDTRTDIQGWETVSVDMDENNKKVGVPTFVQTMSGLFYNKEILAEVGLDFENNPPATVEELFEAFDKIKAAGYTPVIADEGSGHQFIYFVLVYWWVQQTGYDTLIAENNGTAKYVDDEGLISALELYHEMYERGYFNGDVLTASDAMSRFMMGNEAAMYPRATSKLPELYEALGDKLGFIKPCDVDVDGVITDSLIGGAGQGFIVYKDTKYPEECAALLAHLTSAEEFVEFYKHSPTAFPNVASVKAEDLGEVDVVTDKLLDYTSDVVFYVDNVVDSDAMAELIRYSADVLTGDKTPMEVAEALDAVIASKN